ncbi:hypothetical protein SOCEGT47_019460 [Sorangium cellulosum]|uniref:Fe-S oxidoreductase n=1 Tax=Sorangium cellulosum TaxID=56 RepID=A0A4V0ND52_SORCE|nr:YkgJ family cysteine cluster protein [Sorangium cellulosum]AUX21462.1 hypothetical protein SOCEGT47_019460 [Sorangium cellulosum]
MGRSTDDGGDALASLDAEIAARAEATAEAAGGWPCRAGCDLCCRRLARPPQLTRLEWARLRAAIDGLPASVRAEVRARMAAMPAAGPLVCPLLDDEHGRCRVYEARPIACRTYGFYVRREHDLVCDEVERHAAGRPVVWGNHASIDVRLERLAGAPRPLGAWLRDDERDGAG